MANPVVLVTAGYDHKIRFWEANTGICSKTIRFQESQVNCLAISPDKALVAAGGNPVIHLYDVNSSQETPLLSYDGHTSNVTALGFQQEGKWMFSSSEDGTVKIWDLRTPTSQRNYEWGRPVDSVVLHPNQAELISGDRGGGVRFWDLAANTCSFELVPVPDVGVRSVSIAADASLLAAGNHQGHIFVWQPSENKSSWTPLVNIRAHESYLLKCVISPNTQQLATASADKTIKLWDTNTWTLSHTLTAHQRWVWDCAFSGDSNYLVSASSDQTAKLWHTGTGEVVRNYTGHSLSVTCAAINDSSA